MNFLEELVAEWYEYQGYFVRRNVRVGKRAKGGHEGELDVVAFHPLHRHLVHVETSMDADSWSERAQRLSQKFKTGEKHIRQLFSGLQLPEQIEKRVVFGIGSTAKVKIIAGAQVLMVQDLLFEILTKLKSVSWFSSSVPEAYPLLRTLQVSWTFRQTLFNE